MGKFFNGKVKKDRGTLIKYGVIAAGIILIILLFSLIAAGRNKKSNVVLELKETVQFEVNSEWPSVDQFFNKIENFDKDLITIGDFDITTVGTYNVTVSADGQGDADITVEVVDTTVPEIVLNDVIIESGEIYSIEDFVESCEDNSGSECIIEYYTESLDQHGNPIDYSAFENDGKYLIKIIAKDESGNATEPKDIYLTIGNENALPPTACQYGNLEYNKVIHTYPIAVIVGDQNSKCALNRDLFDNSTIQKPVEILKNKDYDRLKKQLTPILQDQYPNESATTTVFPEYIAVLNAEQKGLVGFALQVKVYVAPKSYEGAIDTNNNLALSYYVRSDGTRDYEVNIFDIEE